MGNVVDAIPFKGGVLFSPDIISRDLVVVNLLSQPPTQIVQSITYYT